MSSHTQRLLVLLARAPFARRLGRVASFVRRSPLALVLMLAAVASAPSLEGYVLGPLRWGTSSVPYYVNPQNRWVSESAAVSAFQTAAAVWNDQSGANIQLVYAGHTNGSSVGMNYKSEVFFRGGTSGAGAAGYDWTDGYGKIVDGDIVIYEDAYRFYAFSGCDGGIYIEAIAVHEFGHVLGLHHSDVPGAVMQPTMPGYCDWLYLTLKSDDIAGIRAMYPSTGGHAPPPNTAPSVTITSPANYISVSETSSIMFSGSASDSQDGNLSGSLSWNSNLLGHLGAGGGFSRTLPAGTHLITAWVTDTGGLSASQSATVIVTAALPPPPPPPLSPPPPTGASLTAHGYKIRGLQIAALSWSGLTSSIIDVYRDGALIGTVFNSGAFTDHIGERGGGDSYTYRVCQSGTSTCSNDATITF